MPEVSRMNFMSDIRVFPGKRDAAREHFLRAKAQQAALPTVSRSVLCDEASRVYFASDARVFFATNHRECSLRALKNAHRGRYWNALSDYF
jgi:hypothetical protein